MTYSFFKKAYRETYQNMNLERQSKQSAQYNRQSKRDGGFTLFVAVLVASLVLAIGFSLGNIVLKQLTIAGSGGGSLIAFYAADSAMECAAYWDRKDDDDLPVEQSPFGTSTPEGSMDFKCGPWGTVRGIKKVCDNSSVCNDASLAATTTFSLNLSDPFDSSYVACASVVVSKSLDENTGEEKTSIETRGYNTNITNIGSNYFCNLDRQRVVERGMLQNY